jgi:hypothetical protein
VETLEARSLTAICGLRSHIILPFSRRRLVEYSVHADAAVGRGGRCDLCRRELLLRPGGSALFSLGKWQVRQLAERFPQSGAVLSRLLAEPHDVLATIVLGNTIANAAMVAIVLELPVVFRFSYDQNGSQLPQT